MDYTDTKLDEIVEERLEHPGCGFGKFCKSDKGGLQVLRISGVFERWENVENVGQQVEVLDLRFLRDRMEKGCIGLESSEFDLLKPSVAPESEEDLIPPDLDAFVFEPL